MALTLTIENETSLPDGGPLSVTVSGKRGIDLGRDTHLDWTLPDPTRFISGKHCEIRWKDGAYWLFDVSTNGTFLYGAQGRLKGPHQLRSGDRLVIGHYIVAVHVDGEAAPAPNSRVTEHAAYQDLWNATADAAPPVDRSLVQQPRQAARAVQPDFLDWAIDVPDASERVPARDRAAERPPEPAPPPRPAAPAAPPPLLDREQDWAKGEQKPAPPPEPAPAVPSPRRPVYVSTEPGGPWGAEADRQEAVGEPATRVVPAAAAEASEMPARAAMPSRHAAGSPPPASPSPAPAAGALSGGTAAGGSADLLARFARGANIPEQVFERQNPEQVAEQLGMLMRLVVENMRQLLSARLEAKRLARSANQTMVQALDNNPLKFSPSAEDAMRIMFGPPTHSYLNAPRALQQSFDDIKTHQLKTYAAMQQALNMLMTEFDPKTIEDETEGDRGLAAVIGSRKARLWDAYVARWQAHARRHDDGLVDVFMQYFAESYDRGGNGIR